MVSFKISIVAVAAFFAHSALAAPSPSVDANGIYVKRAASCTFPSPPKTSSLSSPMTVKGTFDGGNVRYDRGKGACSGQKEGGDKDAVFLLENGATLKNVVIGANQAEGVHCKGSCNIYNVWFEDSSSVTSVKSMCDTFQGNDSGKEPPKLTSNKSNASCKF
ncbi:hypothetical protein RSAG8_06644, partial [Rhizoctonia solani AG-8 WAC10335]